MSRLIGDEFVCALCGEPTEEKRASYRGRLLCAKNGAAPETGRLIYSLLRPRGVSQDFQAELLLALRA
jgi:hypothetical protein